MPRLYPLTAADDLDPVAVGIGADVEMNERDTPEFETMIASSSCRATGIKSATRPNVSRRDPLLR
jgi:hypothetical protein